MKLISVRIVFSGGLMAAFFTKPHQIVSDFLQKSWKKHRDLVWNQCLVNGMRLPAVLPVFRQGKIILFTITLLCARASEDFYFDDTTEYQVEIIDTWEMTITDGGIHKGKFRVKLPGERVYGGEIASSEVITIFIQKAQLCMRLGFLSINILNRFSEFVMIHSRF